ncbi:hypothetical protein SAMN02745704_00935 [Paucidesulfovibrio gracilis DSM 16080]|uniref:Tetratricopeptide repeat-containing protein n=1 Tax=Paucidesulfovibrio gracilis DSM 16080 TaxID=1121449 RepID=A0A1T4WIQ3_9BACT|nr:tetratricopeptide repeat protein [Paucidesulfovibrio gracilis]SKA77077.1 hypothetical protein SAMN02745704_00935 [Paucidesulfovibrio gracilis DSM 16080]
MSGCSKSCGRCRMLGRVGDLCRSGMALCAAQEHELAERVLRMALDLVREYDLGPILEAKTANNLGLVYAAMERENQAGSQFARALQLIRGRVGTDNKLYRTVNNNYTQVIGQQVRQYKNVVDECAGRCVSARPDLIVGACACGR